MNILKEVVCHGEPLRDDVFVAYHRDRIAPTLFDEGK
jgi:hypothetical protein